MSAAGSRERVLADLSEDELLKEIFALLPSNAEVQIGPGDDTALLQVNGGVLATTDTMVLGRDWLDEWSTGIDVGAKCVAQNAADIAAMGGVTTGLLVTLVADPATPVQWVLDFATGLSAAAGAAGIAVLGGDLSSAPAGVRMVSIAALGEVTDAGVVTRDGAEVGDVIAVHGSLGQSAAGLLLLQRDDVARGPELVEWHRRPRPEYHQGPAAARAGAHAMLDISDGLVRDARRIASASGCQLALSTALLDNDIRALEAAVGDDALQCVLTGGEEHSLLATFPSVADLPLGWRQIGVVHEGDGVTLDGIAQNGGGWDHFAG